MNNEQLERELRLALLHDDPGPVPDELRWRIEVVPDELPRRVGAAQRSGAWRLLAALALTAAVGVVGVVIARSLPGRPVSVGPTTHPQATMSPGPSSSPSPSLIVPVPGAWGGLRWSAPGSIAGPGAGLDSLVTFDGRFFVSATVPAGSSAEVAIWQSADGTTWTRLAPGGGVFAGAQHVTLVATSRGLVAWGPVGQPVCTAPGAGQTCGPAPVMIWSSPDGTTWTRTPEASPFAGATIRSMAGGPAGLVVVGDTGFDGPAIWGSADGTAWQRLPLPASIFGQAHFETVGASAAAYVLGGSVGGRQTGPGGAALPTTSVAAAWRSLDGRTWTRATVARPGGLGASIDDIELGAQGMVALGATADSKGGAAWTSADGRTWAPIALSAASGTAAAGAPRLPSGSVVGDGSHLVGVTSDRGALSYWASSDGLAWHSLSLSGATATDPWEAGDPTHPERWIQQVYVVPDGLVVTGQASTALPETVLWRARALP